MNLASYEERSREARRVPNVFTSYLHDPDASEVCRAFTALAENKPRWIRAERKAGGVEFSWCFGHLTNPCACGLRSKTPGKSECYSCRQGDRFRGKVSTWKCEWCPNEIHGNPLKRQRFCCQKCRDLAYYQTHKKAINAKHRAEYQRWKAMAEAA